MENNNIYDDLFNIYEHKHNVECNHNSLQSKLENELDTLFKDDFKTYENIVKQLYSVLYESNKRYYIAGIKTALELLK